MLPPIPAINIALLRRAGRALLTEGECYRRFLL